MRSYDLGVDFTVCPGTPGLGLSGIAHVLIPGRGRSVSGFALTDEGQARVLVAHAVFEAYCRKAAGHIVCSGYKSPADTGGAPWSPPDSPAESFQGMPEADLMKASLIKLGVPEGSIDVERHSIDTATNLLRSEAEGHFHDDRPVAIVAQLDHLRRILGIIAPRTLRRPYLGVVAPSANSQTEGPIVDLVSRFVLRRLPDNADSAIAAAHERASRAWWLARLLGKRGYHQT